MMVPQQQQQQQQQQPSNHHQQQQLYTLKPLHVMAVGAGILGSGVFLTGALSYRQAGKQLAAEGIDAGIRRAILPHALKALSGSLLLTGVAAAGMFWAMEGAGLVNARSATSSDTFRTAFHMLLKPQALQQQLGQQKQQQQQQQQQ